MIGISIAAEKEWEVVLDYYDIKQDELKVYPFGQYFEKQICEITTIFYWCGTRKVNSSAATQYMINIFNLNRVIVLGTCAGINDKHDKLDIFIPNKTVQYDCTVKEIEPFIKERFTIEFNVKDYTFNYNTGTIGTADKAVVMWQDYLELKENNIDIADTESGAIAYVCDRNNVECIIAVIYHFIVTRNKEILANYRNKYIELSRQNVISFLHINRGEFFLCSSYGNL